MSRETDVFADHYLCQAGLYPQPPVDVVDLAHRLGVTEIRPAPLVEDGRLEITPQTIQILVRPDLGPARRRFTVAHEIAHLLIEGRPTLIAKRDGAPRNDTERMCDEIAAGILLPYRWVQENFSAGPHRLATVREVAEQAQVSMGAALVRLKEVVGWHHTLLRWRRDDTRWRFVAGAGVPKPIFGQVATAPETSRALDHLQKTDNEDCIGELPIMLRSSICKVSAETSIRGRSAMALVDLIDMASRPSIAPQKTHAPTKYDADR